MGILSPRLIPIALIAMGASSALAAPVVNLNGLGYVQYGDALSYSLPAAGISLASTPGQIKDLIVVATGAEGNPVTTNSSGLDNAYSTPSGVSGESFFYTNPLTSRGTTGTVAFNGVNTWDASLLALKNFLADDDMVVFFNNNQINADGTASQSLAAWARIWLTDTTGAVVGNSTFEFTNDNSKYALVTEGGGGTILGDPATYTAPGSGAGNPDHVSGDNTDYVLSGGSVCSNGFVLVPCGSPGASAPINHNLGADEVAYAILFPEMNSLMNGLFSSVSDSDLASYTLHADVRLGCELKEVVSTPRGNNVVLTYSPTALYGQSPSCAITNGWGTGLNNGYEQIFIGTAARQTVTTVPEPSVLALLGIALLSFGAVRRRT